VTADSCGGSTGKKETTNKLLSLSNAEIRDAIDVLRAKGLHSDAVLPLSSAISRNNSAIGASSSDTRKSLMTDGRISEGEFVGD
jgi:hypothetical protein